MNRFIIEDVHFKITVVDGLNALERITCRNGHEIGDTIPVHMSVRRISARKPCLKPFL